MLDPINYTTPTPEIFGNENAFRSELAKFNPEKQTENVAPAPTPDMVATPPEDVRVAIEESSAPEYTQPEEEMPEPEQEASQDVDSTEAPEQTKSHLIPKSRFNQEIEKRKSLEQQLQKEREERIRYETQLQMIGNMQQQQALQQQTLEQQLQQEPLDPLDTDTYNYAKREIESLKAQLANVSAESQTRAQEMFNVNTVTAQEAAFSQKHPDFKDAMQHVQKVEFNIAKNLLGDEQAAHAYVADKLRDALTRSINSGRNAAETIYNMAKTYGYSQTPIQTKMAPKLNVEAISKNMESSANTSNIGNSGTFGNVPVDIAAAMDKSGRLDPALFHKQLERIQRNH